MFSPWEQFAPVSNEHLIADYSLIPRPKENKANHAPVYIFWASCTIVAKVVLELGTIIYYVSVTSLFSKLGSANTQSINELGSHFIAILNVYYGMCIHALNTKQCAAYMARVLTNLLLHYSKKVFKFILPP